ncbi:two-component system C4-dicarboxylate transport sensor histidine kinase DctB [Rubricella aquisinus]|uniref:C4-dicarboxylate transport sensor protein DctB n=1 Tax=Rubricella aquisinus TaxID=2028108 RepID=A0A840WY90_9RHOB|nr:ATP-binding protein [Rubricella aquisinus]MBB5514635.1 two-component system C4-dicarboxylate transport sensor histidine kinase DctB [Rubricella aquisinus]
MLDHAVTHSFSRMVSQTDISLPRRLIRLPRPATGVVLLAALLISGLLWISNIVLTDRYTATLAERALVRSTLHSSAVSQQLTNYQVATALMAQDRTLVAGLSGGAVDRTLFHLASLQAETGVEALYLYSGTGTLIANSVPEGSPLNHASAPYFQAALDQDASIFAMVTINEGDQRFLFSRRIIVGGRILGVLVAEVDLTPLQRDWAEGRDQVFVTNSEDIILLSTRTDWRFRALAPFLDAAAVPRNVSRMNLLPMLNLDWNGDVPTVEIEGIEYLRVQRTLDFRGWRLTYLAPLQDVKARVNGVLALEVMIFSILAALTFYITARRAARQSERIRRESEELRALNARLTQEIEERMRVEQSLEIAERSLEQSSKLAALGQMSAAIAHELNQPLAAMKTYIAGAALLLRRNRPDEAVASFQRIEDLITRMNALTQQLKSFARKGSKEMVEVDMRTVVTESLAIMSPQIGQRHAVITRVLPDQPVLVKGDALRLEQIFINLMRNALDAMQGDPEPKITVELFAGEKLARAQVRDAGPGLSGDPSQLFEPFYTTKTAGDGVGLGLAISAQIASDLGGSLSARNGKDGGAVFELSLPLAHTHGKETTS